MITEAWSHQLDAYNFIKSKPAAMLAMDMGTGKTYVAIADIVNSKAKWTLVFAPRYVVPVWADEIKKHSSRYIHVVELGTGPIADRLELLKREIFINTNLSYQVVFVINYDAVASRRPRKIDPKKKPRAARLLQDFLLSRLWNLVILDESHKIKKPGGATSFFFSQLKKRTARRRTMTGTPFHNTPLDIYAQYRFLDTSIFGTSYMRFKKKYAIENQWGGVSQIVNEDDLRSKFYQIAFRVDASILDLPEETHIFRKFDLEKSAKKIYKDMDADLVAQVREGRVTAANGAVKLLRLIQITGGYVHNEHGVLEHVSLAKAELLQELLDDLDEPVVVFGFFHGDLHSIQTVCKNLGKHYEEISGRKEAKAFAFDRSYWKSSAQDKDKRIVAIQPKSGAHGISCVRAKIAILYSTGLISPGDYDQACKRVLRPGQLHPVSFIHLLAKGTRDVTVHRALINKKNAVEALLTEMKEKDHGE